LNEEKEKLEETLRYLDLYLIPKPVYSYQDELNYEKYMLDQKAKNKIKKQMERIKDTDQKQYEKYHEELGNRIFKKINFVKEGESKILDSKEEEESQDDNFNVESKNINNLSLRQKLNLGLEIFKIEPEYRHYLLSLVGNTYKNLKTLNDDINNIIKLKEEKEIKEKKMKKR